jgi:DNA-binding response OmpR family regulator
MTTSTVDTLRDRPESEGERSRVLCLDDDASVLALCRAALTRAGFAVDTATDGWAGLKEINERPYDAVLLDLMMPSLHGRTVLSLIQQSHPEVLSKVILMTGASDNAISDLYGKVGGIIRKPLKIDSLVDFVSDFTVPIAK